MSASNDFKYDVFLSHSSKDKAVVRPLAERLRNDGIKVWFDEWELTQSDNISASIDRGLDESRVLVLCMSANAFGSDWPQLEAQTFRFRDPLNKRRRFIALRFDDAAAKGTLTHSPFIDWRPLTAQDYEQLKKFCRVPSVSFTSPAERGWLLNIIELPHRKERTEQLTFNLTSVKRTSCLSPIYCFSRDGSRAIIFTADGKLQLWDLESGKSLQTLRHGKRILHIEWSDDEERILLFEEEDQVRLLDINKDRILADYSRTLLSKRQMDCFRLLACGLTSREIQQRLGLYVLTVEQHLQELRKRLELERRKDLRQFIVNFYAGNSKIKSPLVQISPQWSVPLAWTLEKERALSKRAGRFRHLRLCTRFDNLEHKVSAVPNWRVAWKKDKRFLAVGSEMGLVTVWDPVKGVALQSFEGHVDRVESIAWDPSERFLLSASSDESVKLWDTIIGRCVYDFQGFGVPLNHVTWAEDGQRALVGDSIGRVWILDLSKFVGVSNSSDSSFDSGVSDQIRYTNAKVLVVGDTNAGKTGLAHRISTGEWKPSEDSTVGAWSTQWQLKDFGSEPGIDREIWLWDFGGQADQRLIHQLYMDRTALILLLFNADQEDVLPGLRDWLAALRRSVKEKIPHFLVAGRIDTGFKASRGKLQMFAKEHELSYHETSAKTGEGCLDLRAAVTANIPWGRMEKRTSPRIFKLIKDEILKLRDEGMVLHTFKELRELLWRRLPNEPRLADEILQTVIGLLDGPGVVKELEYGTYVLLAPEWINAYAQAVIRTLRSAENDLGVLPLKSIAEGKLIYQSVGRDSVAVEMKRLPPAEERVVLSEMERQLEHRGLCLRQGDKLVFPSHCGRDRPTARELPSVFVSYAIKGFLDDIYATLVVKLADSQSFKLSELWRDAADFVTLTCDFHMGIKLTRETASIGEIGIYFGKGVSQQEQVIFANYIHAHLEAASEKTSRLRHYVCPRCHTPKGNPQVLMEKLLMKRKDADTECDKCGDRFPLWDALEKKFASESIRKQVEELQAEDIVKLTSRRKGKLLVLDVGARITSANQKWMEVPGDEDDGIDVLLEFTDDDGNGIGKGLCLQLKAGNSFLKKRKTDGVEIFSIKKPRWVKTWLSQPYPVMLVIGTFSDESEQKVGKQKLEFSDIRWMEITSVLKELTKNGTKSVAQIEFKGERMDMASIRKWREKLVPVTTAAAS